MASPPRNSSTAILIAAALAVLAFAAAAGMRPTGGWYSSDTRYRQQTESMFHGTFALQPLPYGQRADWAWGRGSQQVWGLGVPLLRMPGEALARLSGRNSFPDRLTLVVLLAIVLAVAARASDPRDAPVVFLTLGLFPALITIVRTRLFVYEEAVAYGYLWAALQAAIVIGAARRQTASWFILGSIVAGYGTLIRPTEFLYGAVTMLILLTMSLRRRQLRLALCCAGAFAAMTLFVLWTNYARFGDLFEFGQRVNVSRWVLDQYAKNFDYPYAHEPLMSAARELTAALTMNVPFNGVSFYANGPAIHPWFSPTVRFREFYFTTGLLPFLMLAAAAWIVTIVRLTRDRRDTMETPAATLAMWSLLSFIAQALFYLRMPTMTSRYVVDFAAAASAGVIALALWCRATSAASTWRWPLTAVIAAMLVLGNARASISPTHAAAPLLTAAEVSSMVPAPILSGPAIPSAYSCGDRIDAIGVPFNGIGWAWNGDCGLDAGSTLFISLPANHSCVQITTERLDGTPMTELPADVEVKLGTARLQRTTGNTVCPPDAFTRQPSGIEIMSLKWVAAAGLNTTTRPAYRLRSITTTPKM